MMGHPRVEMPSMADYGVGPSWEGLPWRWAAERLTGARNFWLVTASAAGRPHALPLWGVWDDDRQRFFFSCAASSRKAANLAVNPQVVVAPEDTVECVSVEGSAQRLHGDQPRWVELYLAKYRALAPELTGDFITGNAMYEVTPERAFGVVEREQEFAARATRWVF